MKTSFSAFALAAFASTAMFSVPAIADTTTVSCTDYIVAVADEVAIQGEAMAGSLAGFEQEVCARSAEMADGATEPTTHPVFIEEMGISARVVIIPLGDDE